MICIQCGKSVEPDDVQMIRYPDWGYPYNCSKNARKKLENMIETLDRARNQEVGQIDKFIPP